MRILSLGSIALMLLGGSEALRSSSTQNTPEGYYFVFLNSRPGRPTLPSDSAQTLQRGHLANITRLHRAGTIAVAGPFEGGGGIFVVRAGSLKEVEDSVLTDPAVRANRFHLEIFPMIIQYGGICEVTEPYEMVKYSFVRYISNGVNLPSSMFMKSDSLIASFSFHGTDEAALIFATQDTSKAHGTSLQASGGEDRVTRVRRLWVARGSFCE
jgi:uncharacterized protein YciI